MQLPVIIVNWNSRAQLVQAVESIQQYHHNLVSSVVIVDNASTDDSVEVVRGLMKNMNVI